VSSAVRKRRRDGELQRGDRVIAVKAIGPVPEGTGGTMKVVDGLTWVRYWIKWDTGHWIGSISQDQVVPADQYDAAGPAADARQAPG
jgi:hypothetical protein